LTPKNYTQLQQLHEKYSTHGETGLDIIGFPCNQFGNQEPKSNEKIAEFVAKYNVQFKMMDKIKVNGSSTHPIFKFLKKALPGTFGNFVKWNFTKFLITRDGEPYKRYGPKESPLSFESDIQDVLAQRCEVCDPEEPVVPAASTDDWETECNILLDKLEVEAERRVAAEEARDAAVAKLAKLTAELEALKARSSIDGSDGAAGGADALAPSKVANVVEM